MKKNTACIIMLILVSGLSVGCGADRVTLSDTSSSDSHADELKLGFGYFNKPTGDMAVIQSVPEPREITNEELQEIDRTMRDFKAPADSLLINDAKSFYYYDKLSKEEKDIYDAILLSVYDSYESVCTTSLTISEDPSTNEVHNKILKVIYGMKYDHPELFWLYNSEETHLEWSYYTERGNDKKYSVYVSLNEPYKKYADEIKAFNRAAEDFLAGIDISASEKSISRSIHDRLLGSVSYDNDVMDTKKNTDRAHTAYGALVANSSGVPHHAVCDGYTQAYNYLMQQAGLEAVYLCGEAGSEDDMGAHAWSIARIDGNWYEVDVTWDDHGTVDDYVSPDDQQYYNCMREALSNPSYCEKIEHYMYAISTSKISNFHSSDTYTYWAEDGSYWISLIGDSVHIRASDLSSNDYVYDKQLMKIAPTAHSDLTGTSEISVKNLSVVNGVRDPSTGSDIYIPGATESSYLWPDADTRYYSESEIDKLTEGQVRYLINEIYAREGYTFKNASWKVYFEQKSWYRASVSSEEFTKYSKQYLNTYEYRNVETLKNYQIKNGFESY